MDQSQIEEITRTILQSQIFRTQLAQILQQFQYRHADISPTLPLNSVIEEVTQCLADITEAALEEDNTHNYITFIKKSQQLYTERQAKMVAQVSKQIEQLKNQFGAKIKALADNVPIKRQINPLKTERMNIAKTIIDNHRSLNVSSKSSIIPNKENKQDHFNQISTTQQTPSCVQRLTEYDKGFERINQIVDEMGRTMEHLSQRIKDKQDTTDNGFNGVWNIISDLQSKISRLEPLLSLVQVCS